ncbi:MAG: hypothetical protein H0U74_05555 [Bradymonadaceae bacterium]|nr:hypothetical protein [Lujinxingiaceae bacterium]
MSRREALGRNRRVAGPVGTMIPLVLGLIGMILAAWFAYGRFTHPARVMGSTVLECPRTSLSVEQRDGLYVVHGCGRRLYARCEGGQCVDADAAR